MKFCLSHNILFSFSLIRLNYEHTFNASDLYFFVRHPLYIFSSEELLFKDIRNYTYFIEEINRAQQQAVARPLGTEGNRGCTRYYMASERVHLYSGARHPRITPVPWCWRTCTAISSCVNLSTNSLRDCVCARGWCVARTRAYNVLHNGQPSRVSLPFSSLFLSLWDQESRKRLNIFFYPLCVLSRGRKDYSWNYNFFK